MSLMAGPISGAGAVVGREGRTSAAAAAAMAHARPMPDPTGNIWSTHHPLYLTSKRRLTSCAHHSSLTEITTGSITNGKNMLNSSSLTEIITGDKTIHSQVKEVEEGLIITHVKMSITDGKHTLHRSSLTEIITRDPGIGKKCGEREEELNLGESRSLARRIIRQSLALLRVLRLLKRMYAESLTFPLLPRKPCECRPPPGRTSWTRPMSLKGAFWRHSTRGARGMRQNMAPPSLPTYQPTSPPTSLPISQPTSPPTSLPNCQPTSLCWVWRKDSPWANQWASTRSVVV